MNATAQPVRFAIEAVAARFSISIEDLLGGDTHEPLRSIRAMAMLVARHATGKSYPHIAKVFGGRHHTTIISGVERGRDLARSSPWYREEAARLILWVITSATHPQPIYRLTHLPSVFLEDSDAMSIAPRWDEEAAGLEVV